MKPRSTPGVATWLLKLFCRSAEHESVAGDLCEQYHLGRGRSWYWRQVLVVVLLNLYHQVARRPLVRGNRLPVRPGFVLLLVLVAGIWLPGAVPAIISAFAWGFLGRGLVFCWQRRHACLIQTLGLHTSRSNSSHAPPLVGMRPLGLL